MAKDTEVIERDVPDPAWRQLAAILRGRIQRGEYEPSHAIPSEKQCEQEFGCARGTVRKAVTELRAEGLVVTVPGRGTYVADPLPPEGGDEDTLSLPVHPCLCNHATVVAWMSNQ